MELSSNRCAFIFRSEVRNFRFEVRFFDAEVRNFLREVRLFDPEVRNFRFEVRSRINPIEILPSAIQSKRIEVMGWRNRNCFETFALLFRITGKGGLFMAGDFLMLFPLLFNFVFIGVGVYIVFAFLKQGKERNALLKEIAEELRRK